jgi:hypothetical protein
MRSASPSFSMTDQMARFSRREFDALSQAERLERCRELAGVLSKRLEASSDFEDEAAAIISDLRRGGTTCGASTRTSAARSGGATT